RGRTRREGRRRCAPARVRPRTCPSQAQRTRCPSGCALLTTGLAEADTRSQLGEGCMAKPDPAAKTIEAGARYVLITECLQNDFFLNPECRLFLQDEAARRI